jgi:hypothetical protein
MKKLLSISPWLIALLCIGIALLYCESDLLWMLQEKNLFLSTSMFFREQMVVPGGFLSWVSTFFTQFFYYPWLGVLLLCGWWWLLMWLTKRAFQVPDQWVGLMLIPVGLLLLTIVDMGYWIYVLKLQGHVFVGTIGTTVLLSLLWAFRCLPSRYFLRTVFIFIVCALGYPLMGIYGLAASLLMAVMSWRKTTNIGKTDAQAKRKIDGKTNGVVNTIVAVLSVVMVPLVCYRYVFYQTNLANIFYAELPLYYVTEESHAYYLPFYFLALFFLLMALVPLKPLAKPIMSYLVQGVLAIVLVGSVAHFWFKDENFHRELAMRRCIEQLDWQGVLKEAAEQEDEPTRAIVMMKNLALSRLGRQGSHMLLYKNGSKDYNAPFGMRLMLVVGPTIYYQYGMLNYCVRLSTEMSVEFGWRVEHLKLLAKSAVLLGEKQQARKYTGLLKKTCFFDDWAVQTEKLIGDSAAIAQDAEMGMVSRMMHYDNVLGSDQGNIERFLMQRLASSRYTGDLYFQEQTLLATLWTKDISRFWMHLGDYIRLHPGVSLPRYYQEAAYLYGKLEGRQDIDSQPFSAEVKNQFERFMQYASRYENADVEVARKSLQFFSNTYYYDYYLMSQLPEY